MSIPVCTICVIIGGFAKYHLACTFVEEKDSRSLGLSLVRVMDMSMLLRGNTTLSFHFEEKRNIL